LFYFYFFEANSTTFWCKMLQIQKNVLKVDEIPPYGRICP
jgi:hypothetical protein